MKWILIFALLLNSCATLDTQRVTTCTQIPGGQTCVESKPLVTGTEAICWGNIAIILGAVLGVAANQ